MDDGQKWARVKELLDSFDGVYGTTGVDWELSLSHCLTEPTCPMAAVAPEGSNLLRYSMVADTVLDAILGALTVAHAELFLGEVAEGNMPFSHPDDALVPDWKAMVRESRQRSWDKVQITWEVDEYGHEYLLKLGSFWMGNVQPVPEAYARDGKCWRAWINENEESGVILDYYHTEEDAKKALHKAVSRELRLHIGN